MQATVINSARTAYGFIDKVIAVASCIAIPVLVATTVVWAVDKPPKQDLWFSHQVEVQHGQESMVSVGLPMAMTMPMRRGRYWITLDVQGQTVYQFPTHTVNDDSRFDFQTLTIDVPRSLPPGHYDVNVHIAYWFNPFKDGKTVVRISDLNVK